MTEPGAHGPSDPDSTMPALLERPKLSNAMARALHRHIMMERERKRQGEPGPKREGTRPWRHRSHRLTPTYVQICSAAAKASRGM